METQTTESEKFITTSVINFINDHTKSNHMNSSLDEIVLSYVVTVLENLATERDEDLIDSFDVEDFCEMLTAYFPEFASIPQCDVSTWIFGLVTSLKNNSANKKEKPKVDIAFDALLGEIEREPRTKRFSESSSDSSYNGSKKSSSCSRTPRVSENSDSEPDVADIIQRLQLEEKAQTLVEMFPDLPRADAQNLVTLANGDLEKSVQMVLLQLEGAGLNHGHNVGILSAKPRLNAKTDVDEKSLKDRIVARYGFIDQAEDTKEFKPALPKAEPKKLVRYRDSQVVSTKGERYSEVRLNKDGEEVKPKTYISKPHKPSN